MCTIKYLAATAFFLCSIEAFSQKTFEQDLNFISRHEKPIVLSSSDNKAKIIVSPKHQGRVLTSTADGMIGVSNGWLDYQGIAHKGGSAGGEDRLWLAPIGSRHSLFYDKGKSLTEENWRVPDALKEKNYPILKQTKNAVLFQKDLALTNYIGTDFFIRINRNVVLYQKKEIVDVLKVELPKGLSAVGFSSTNTMTNLGENWNRKDGLITLWSLGMFPGYNSTISVFPLSNKDATPTVHQYLNPLSKKRLKVSKKAVFYKTDGRYRSKIGLPKRSTKNVMAAYTPELKRLTIVTFLFEDGPYYPISFEQDVPHSTPGDVINAYNNGGAHLNGADIASFYELESSAQLKPLKKNERITHRHATFHFFGDIKSLDLVSTRLLGVTIDGIISSFSE